MFQKKQICVTFSVPQKKNKKTTVALFLKKAVTLLCFFGGFFCFLTATL